MPWIIGGAAIGGALIGSSSASKASKTQAAATDRATQMTEGQYQTTRLDQAPARELGSDAINMLRRMVGVPGSVDESDPRFKAILNGIRGAADAEHKGRFGGISIFDPRSGYNTDKSGYETGWTDQARQQYQQQFGNEAPAPDAGSLSKKFTVDDFWQDPVTQVGYQYGKDLGEKTLKSMAPLTYGSDSGAAVKEATKFGQDYAGSKAAESQARYEGQNSNIFNRLMAMIGGGQVSNQVTANAGNTAATGTAGLVSAGGNAQAASQIAQGNAFSGGLGNIANWWQQNATLDKLMKAGRTGVGNLQSWAQQNYGTPGYYALGEG